jgi:CPA2 family monovalent cation:H+ antiporter-2/glutathione-regulated potassium-efflux system protein KefB
MLTSAIIASMVLTPFLIMLYDLLMPAPAQPMDGIEKAESLSANILLIGFGRFGQIVSQPLLANGYSLSIIETSTQLILDLEPYGFKVYYGDGARLDILHAAGADDAKLIIVAVDDRSACLKIVEIVKSAFPHTPVFARAYDREHAIELIHAGVDWQLRETVESALALAEKAMEALGTDAPVRRQVMDDIRRRDSERLAKESVGGLLAARDLIRNNAESSRRPN